MKVIQRYFFKNNFAKTYIPLSPYPCPVYRFQKCHTDLYPRIVVVPFYTTKIFHPITQDVKRDFGQLKNFYWRGSFRQESSSERMIWSNYSQFKGARNKIK